MPSCSAVGCTNRRGKNKPGLSFHRFPKTPMLRAAWIVACRRKDWLPSSVSTLCSEHFSEDLIDRTSTSIVRLKENAIPSIFKDYTPDVEKIQIKSHSSNNESLSETAKENATESTVGSNSPEDETCITYVLSLLIPEKNKSSEICLASTPTTASINKEVIQPSKENMPETATNSDVIQQTVCLNSPINESSTKNKSPVQASEEFKASGYRMAYTRGMKFVNNEARELSDESASEPDVMETSIGSNSPINGSSIEVMRTVRIPVVESDSEDYPTEDLEKIYLKRKLQESNNLVKLYRKKIRLLQQQNRRWKKRLEQAQRSLKVLKQTNEALFL